MGCVRDLPPRDVSHKWTVDRHIVETAVNAAPLTTRVARSDLLALGALLHDIGKGRGVDHCVLGADLVIPIAERLGLSPQDVDTLSGMVRHHLLLPVTATRSDLNDPETIESVAEALGGDAQLLELLHALAEADSKATGPGVWSDWKASLVADLVRRCRLVMAGEPLPQAEPTTPHYLSLAADHGVHVEITPGDGERMHAVMAGPGLSGIGVESRSRAGAELVAGPLGVGQRPRGCRDRRVRGVPAFWFPARTGPAATAVRRCAQRRRRRPRHARKAATATPPARRWRRAGEMQVGAPLTRSTAPPRILWLDTAAPGDLVVEVRAMDRVGLLALLAQALERAGADIAWAKVNTFGSTAADVFCVTVPAESNGDHETGARAAMEKHLLAVLGATADALGDEPVRD